LVFNSVRANWKYEIVILAIIAILLTFRGYQRWQQSWLSGLVDTKIREMRQKRRRDWLGSLRRPSIRTAYWTCRGALFRSIRFVQNYIWGAPKQIRDFYFPSLASFFIVALVFLIFFLTPHLSEFSLTRPKVIFNTLQDDETAKKVFEGLIVIAVALIIFVSESIRDSKNTERKRVLLRISYL
jgi:uncharacterized BrkB/YihY/UPF0761 family membrane protein